jgi:hypothetical protein
MKNALQPGVRPSAKRIKGHRTGFTTLVSNENTFLETEL